MTFLRSFGLPRLLIVGFLAAIWVVAAGATSLDLRRLLSDSLVRAGMNGVLVLALVPMVRCGSGLNFGLPLGIVCGLVGQVVALEVGAADAASFGVAVAVGAPVAVVAGIGYAALLERVRGQEMMVGMYVGFGAVALMSIVWLVAPLHNPEVIMPIGGHGARQSLVLRSMFAAEITRWQPNEVARLLYVWLGVASLVALFFGTRAGAALAAAGENERFARAAGIPVARMRRLGIVLSTVLGAVGIVIYAHALGLAQLYKAPLYMGLHAVAALLLGGASTQRATVVHAIAGTLLFQALLTAALPVVNDLVQTSAYAEALANVPETARLIIGNGVILYALTRRD